MAFFREHLSPLIILLIFLVSLVAVSARIFLPSDMVAPAPIEDVEAASLQTPAPVSAALN